MPELPEIETIRLTLGPLVLGQKIITVDIRQFMLRFPVRKEEIERWVVGQKISAVERRAKYLIFRLANEASLVFHLGMSGRLGLYKPYESAENHTHLILSLENSRQIRYRDPRRFGFIEVVQPSEIYFRFSHLGYEPLSRSFDGLCLFEKIRTSRRTIKTLLMDSTFVVGIGNIYANEALFLAEIDPRRIAASLNRDDCHRLVGAVKTTLKKAIAKGGTTLNDFRDALGEPGFFQLELSVYGREKKKCVRCGSTICRIVTSNRSTFFCPHCQH
jgi:formamidopyrimidine-DNA glycosylase